MLQQQLKQDKNWKKVDQKRTKNSSSSTQIQKLFIHVVSFTASTKNAQKNIKGYCHKVLKSALLTLNQTDAEMMRVHESVDCVKAKQAGKNLWHIISVQVPHIEIFKRQSYIRNKNILLLFSEKEDLVYPDITSLQMNNQICWFAASGGEEEDEPEEPEKENTQILSKSKEETSGKKTPELLREEIRLKKILDTEFPDLNQLSEENFNNQQQSRQQSNQVNQQQQQEHSKFNKKSNNNNYQQSPAKLQQLKQEGDQSDTSQGTFTNNLSESTASQSNSCDEVMDQNFIDVFLKRFNRTCQGVKEIAKKSKPQTSASEMIDQYLESKNWVV